MAARAETPLAAMVATRSLAAAGARQATPVEVVLAIQAVTVVVVFSVREEVEVHHVLEVLLLADAEVPGVPILSEVVVQQNLAPAQTVYLVAEMAEAVLGQEAVARSVVQAVCLGVAEAVAETHSQAAQEPEAK